MRREFKTQLSLFLGALFISTGLSYGQVKEKNTYNVDSDVEIEINSSYVDFVFETWNKDKVEITAELIGDDLSREEAKELLDAWQFEVDADSDRITINSGTNFVLNWDSDAMEALEGLESLEALKNLESLEELGNININLEGLEGLEELGPMLEGMIGPMIANMSSNPLPPDFLENLEGLEFDYDAYEADKEGYMKEWEAELEERFGEDFEIKMEAWGEEYGAKWEAWGEEFGEKWAEEFEEWGEKFGQEFSEKFNEDFVKDIEKWAESFGEDMEEWGEKFGKDMEKWAEEFEAEIEEMEKDGNKVFIMNGNDVDFKGVKRVIKIKMPKDAQLDLNVRHGEVKLGAVNNIKADLNYATFIANTVDGGDTSINVSYAPIYVQHWKNGALGANYVDTCVLNQADNITMEANSSNVTFGVISKDAMLNGSYGALVINNLGSDFKSVALNLDNTDANIILPSFPLDIFYNGKKSKLDLPNDVTASSSDMQGNAMVRGWHMSADSNKLINITAAYSNIKVH